MGETQLLSFDLSPPTPTTKEDDLSVLRLIRSRRVGPTTFHRLIAEYGSATAALEALPQIAAAAGVKAYAACPEAVAIAELNAGHQAGAKLLRFDSPEYPSLLRQIPDAPPVLWVKGDLAALGRPMVGVIGSRNASSLGLRMARGLARGLAETGIVVTAGLARGIDTAAHEASCSAGTVAVMAGGIDVIYPAENAALAANICEAGCLVTETAPGVEPVARHFPARNRIIAGLCAGVVVVEAAHRSGTLITARLAAEQGREVMAVPGHPIDARASGCNALIRDGATLVRNAEDVMQAIGFEAEVVQRDQRSSEEAAGTTSDRPRIRLASSGGQRGLGSGAHSREKVPHPEGRKRFSTPEAVGSATRNAIADTMPTSGRGILDRVLELLGPSPVEEDQLIRDMGVSPAKLAPVLLDLELDGRLARMPGGKIALIG